MERGAERRRVGAGIAHGGQARLGQGVINDEYVHGGQPTACLDSRYDGDSDVGGAGRHRAL
ncbi:hypothetical protein Pflav_063950 [Phytohabitans flavus]|uniref:Uncharacterized protein n=1 Tax=Phytohabitans flavus TaxID=1076124 RepID=A0A6F8Y1M8_9ACTN|nr:hypothetical protein Pflav_063950 [Phytohabitans flavus]